MRAFFSVVVIGIVIIIIMIGVSLIHDIRLDIFYRSLCKAEIERRVSLFLVSVFYDADESLRDPSRWGNEPARLRRLRLLREVILLRT